MEYKKPPLSIEDLADSLIERGLKNHPDNAELKKQVQYHLSSIGYHRLSPYWDIYKKYGSKKTNKPRPFYRLIKFDDILRLYNFDRELRLLVMDAIERIEIALRAYWSQEINNSNSHGYTNQDLFSDKDNVADTNLEKPKKTKKAFYIENYALLKKDLKQKKDSARNYKNNNNPYLNHYYTTYTDPEHPPTWAVVEMMSFSTLSKWFKSTHQDIQKKIADKFISKNIEKSIQKTESIFHSLAEIRNICAHHGRLWNRTIPNSARVIEEIGMTSDKKKQKLLYNHLIVIHHLMFAITQKNEWTNRLMELLDTLDTIETKKPYHQEMGFPLDWKMLKPWSEVIKEKAEETKKIKAGLTF